MVGEMQNRINPNKGKFVICLIGFLLFWGVSFMTNVHYMLMKDEGLKVVSAELGNYKSYVDDATRSKKEEIKGRQEIHENYVTAEIKTEAELENERREYVERMDAERNEKAINARTKRKKNDRIFQRVFFGTIGAILIAMVIMWLRG